jgi:ketosteroid isomerase-like protein
VRSGISVALLVIAAFTAGKAWPQEQPDSAGAVRAIRTALSDWVAAANQQDWKSASRVWAPDLIGWYPGQPDDTYAREMERAARPKAGGPPTRYQVDVVEVLVSGRLAVVRDIWRFTTSPSKPDSSVAVVRSYEIWTRQPDRSWKISRWISAPEPPGSIRVAIEARQTAEPMLAPAVRGP